MMRTPVHFLLFADRQPTFCVALASHSPKLTPGTVDLAPV
jgi:hypothetical protein